MQFLELRRDDHKSQIIMQLREDRRAWSDMTSGDQKLPETAKIEHPTPRATATKAFEQQMLLELINSTLEDVSAKQGLCCTNLLEDELPARSFLISNVGLDRNFGHSALRSAGMYLVTLCLVRGVAFGEPLRSARFWPSL
jgi:hypothetical protein